MAGIQRITDFIPNTLIVSQEVDDEFNQLVNLLSGVSDDNDAILRYTHATDPVLKVDQLGAGDIQEWLQNGTAKARIANDGTVETPALVHPSGSGRVVIKGYPFSLQVDTSTVNSAGAGPDVLHTFSLPAGSLATNGDYLNVWYSGSMAAVDRDKFIQAQFDGTSYENGGGFDFNGSTGWNMFNRIVRIDSTHVRTTNILLANLMSVSSANVASSLSIGGFAISRNSPSFVVANLDSNAITMRVRSVVSSGVPAAADVVQFLSIIELVQR